MDIGARYAQQTQNYAILQLHLRRTTSWHFLAIHRRDLPESISKPENRSSNPKYMLSHSLVTGRLLLLFLF